MKEYLGLNIATLIIKVHMFNPRHEGFNKYTDNVVAVY